MYPKDEQYDLLCRACDQKTVPPNEHETDSV